MRKLMGAILALLLLHLPVNAPAEPKYNHELEAPVEFLNENIPFVDDDETPAAEPFRIRAAYRIELPEDTSDVKEIILESYAPYAKMYLIEISDSFAEIGPILSSRFCCVGLLEDSTYEFCPTPQHIAARIFDYKALEVLVITPLALYAD